MKNIFILFITFNILYANTAEEVRLKIEKALVCNARITNISEVKIATLEESTQYRNAYYVEGVYKSVSSVGGNKFGFSFGDEFHPSSGSFEGLVDKNLKIKKLYWKVGMGQGMVKSSCLLTRQRRF